MFKRLSLLLLLMLLVIVASTRMQAQTGTCGGQMITLPFTDVPGSNIFFCAIAEAYFSGLTNGTSATTYSPEANVTREQVAAFTTRTLDQSLRRGSRRAALGQWWTTTPYYDIGLGVTTVGNGPEQVQSDGADLWVVNFNSATVSRVRASDGKLLESWTVPQSGRTLLVAMGQVFVASQTGPSSLYRIDPSQSPGAVTVVTNQLGDFPLGMAFDGARIWTSNFNSISIVTPGPTIPWAVTTVPGFASPVGILYDGSNIWVAESANATIKKLDANGAVLRSIAVGISPFFPVFDGTNIWVPSPSGSITVVRVKDSQGNPLENPFVLATLTGNGLSGSWAAAFDGQRILITNESGGSVSLWKAADLTPLGFFPIGPGIRPRGACSDGLNFWIVLGIANKLARF